MKIAIVILNWNGKRLLQQFLPQVIEHAQGATVYIVDNASTDGSMRYVAQQFPNVKRIQNSENGGYAKGYNQALQQIDAEVYCLLNNDVEVTKGWLQPIENLFEKEPKTAIIQPKLLDYKLRNTFEYAGAAGGFIDKYGFPYCRGRVFQTIEQDQGQYEGVSRIFWASGACFFIRRAVFEELGGFDTDFFAHMEEIDLCWRSNNLGYDVKYTSDSVVYHVGGATLNHQSPQKTFLNFRNSLYTLVKNADGHLFPMLFLRLVLDGLAGLRFLFTGKPQHTRAILQAHGAFYKHWPALTKQRKKLGKKRPYYSTKSLVISYFLRNKKYYADL